VKRLPPGKVTLEMDFCAVPIPMGEKGKRPYIPYMLLIVDRDSGIILGSELLHPEPSLEAMWGLIPLTVVYQLAHIGVVPRQIRVRTPLLTQLLQPLVEELGFEVRPTPTLRSLDQAKRFLLQRLI